MSLLLRQSGFTLLEMVFAMALFAIGLLGVCQMTSGLMSNNAAARNRADATRLAQSTLETLGQVGYSEIAGSMEKDFDAAGVPGGGVFQREVTVAEKAAPARKEVTVTISWRYRGAHRVVLKTIFVP